MSETEMLKQRIQELEVEIKQLKDILPKEKQPKRSLCPKDIAEKYGGLMKKGIAWEYSRFPFMDSNDLTNLSRIIRRSCFLRKAKDRTYISANANNYKSHTLACDTGKTLKEMNDEEYSKYCEILDKVLCLFQEYGCYSNNNN